MVEFAVVAVVDIDGVVDVAVVVDVVVDVVFVCVLLWWVLFVGGVDCIGVVAASCKLALVVAPSAAGAGADAPPPHRCVDLQTSPVASQHQI